MQDRVEPSKLQVAAVVIFYMVSALVMVFVNKVVLNATPSLTFTLLLSQSLTTVGLLRIASVIHPQRFKVTNSPSSEFRHIVPVVAAGVSVVATNALCLKAVDATFFQIARGLVLPMTIITSCIAFRKLPNRKVFLAAGIVTVGYMIGVRPTRSFTTDPFSSVASMGLFWGIMSSALTACHAVMGKVQVNRQANIVQLAHDKNLLAAVFILPLVWWQGEMGLWFSMLTGNVVDGQDLRTFVWGAMVTGVFGTFLALAGLLSIKITSPVTHMFSTGMRSVVQTALGYSMFGDSVSSDRIMSLSIILAGTLYYTAVQSQKVKGDRRSSEPELPLHSPAVESKPRVD